MATRHRWLALLALVTVGGGASAAPVVGPLAAVPAASVRAAAPVPAFDLTRLFDRMTVPLGVVPVID